jgi:SAM-dependent methyltransferase
VPDSWWEGAYRGGHTPWDPGAYDGHLPGLLRDHEIAPCAALDIGCGTGKSLIWLALRGFDCTGIDLAPTALAIALRNERKAGVMCRWLRGVFPEDFGDEELPPGRFGFVMERGCLQHALHDPGEINRFLAAVRRVLSPGGLFYSLIAADQGRQRFYGPHWSREQVRSLFSAHLRIEALELSVFTPGESGSMGAWLVAASRPESDE